MTDLNHVALIGRWAADPEQVQSFDLVQGRIAFSTSTKNSDGSWGEKSNFMDVKLPGERFLKLTQYMHKGDRVGLSGNLVVEEWEAEGQKRSKVVLVARDVQLLTPKQDDAAPATTTTNDAVPF